MDCCDICSRDICEPMSKPVLANYTRMSIQKKAVRKSLRKGKKNVKCDSLGYKRTLCRWDGRRFEIHVIPPALPQRENSPQTCLTTGQRCEGLVDSGKDSLAANAVRLASWELRPLNE
ncbi:hypothetical protein Ddc_14574 [Ditylenchus destructor]|nr:hypothetical protein Ddc_14574 [Ditylenchus destructor]